MQKSIKFVIFFLIFGSIVLKGAINEKEVHGSGHSDSEQLAGHHEEEFDIKNTIFHHIGNQNVFSIGSLNLPLPVILYAPEKGWTVFMSSKFGIGHHSNGHKVVDSYVLSEGSVFRIEDKSFPQTGVQEIEKIEKKNEIVDDSEKEVVYAYIGGKEYRLENRTTWDGGYLGGGITSFYDFSISKNVVFMLLTVILLLWLFVGIANSYKRRKGLAPTGMQNLFEVIILFVRDEVAVPFIGHKYHKYLPYLLSIFFFILFLNLLGQIPFLGSVNTTGNLSTTMGLALVAFFIVNINGRRAYWEHVLWMPGVPWWVKATILTPVEFIGLFIKPFTLMLRLFANITAGHMVVLVFIGLIFIFGKAGQSVSGSITGMAMSVPLVLFMMALELIVAFIQAFVFTMLVASYIGAAVEEHH
jgi:F-type H+-transporting ATPase subunit a